MKVKFLLFMVLIMLLTACSQPGSDTFSSDNETSDSNNNTTQENEDAQESVPVDINTPEELLSIMDNPNGNYRLTADIDLANHHNWLPLGGTRLNDTSQFNSLDRPFNGTLDGQGYSILNFHHNYSYTSEGGYTVRLQPWGFGLFYTIGPQGVVKNLHIVEAHIGQISGVYGAGIMANFNEGLIQDCSVSGRLGSSSSEHNVGMVVNGNSGTIRRVTADASGYYDKDGPDELMRIVVGRNNVGGIAGSNGGIIEQCTFKGRVTGSWQSGMIAGSMSGGAIRNCHVIYSGTELSFIYDTIGGLVGNMTGGLVENNLMQGALYTGMGNCHTIGGLVGKQDEDPRNPEDSDGGIIRNNVMDCQKIYYYSGGAHNGMTQVGTIIGFQGEGIAENNYQSSDTFLNTYLGGPEPTDGIFSSLITTHSEVNAGTVPLFNLWDFAQVWEQTDRGPRLRASFLED